MNETAIVVPLQHESVTPDQFRAQVENGHAKASILADIITQRGLAVRIGQSQHIKFEGWQILAQGYGLTIDIEWTRAMGNGGYEARAMLLDASGSVLRHADAECGTRGDDTWIDRPAFQQRSMAQTRASGKVCRLVLGWVMELAGYSATPAEEMIREKSDGRQAQRQTFPQSPPESTESDAWLPAWATRCPDHSVAWEQRRNRTTQEVFFSHNTSDGYCNRDTVLGRMLSQAGSVSGYRLMGDIASWLKAGWPEYASFREMPLSIQVKAIQSMQQLVNAVDAPEPDTIEEALFAPEEEEEGEV